MDSEEFTKKLADKGLIIEAGWTGFVIACKLQDAPPIQLREMRKAFFAGAAHLFASMLAFLEPGHDATEKDMDRMSQLHAELERFQKEFEAQVKARN